MSKLYATKCKKLLVALLSFITFSFANAQENASIVGQIIDATGNTLPNAQIQVKGTKINAITDLTGNFSLNNLQAGKQTISISFVGYKTLEKEVFLQKGQNNIGKIILTQTSSKLGDVVVKGTMAPSQMKAYTIKKNALAIMDVISADAIGKLPDRNAAEAVQRVQGVAVARYHGEADMATVRGTPFAWTSTLFNGSRLPSASVYGNRASILDAVPSEIIQYVQVAKALTPDMEGDAIGGSINFITRTAPVKQQLNVSLAGGYNNFSKDGTYNGSIVYGNRFLNDKLGVIIAAAIWDRNWGADSYDVVYNTGLANDVQRKSLTSVQFKRYMGKRQTYGSNLGLEYKFNANHKIFFRGLLDKFNDVRPVYESIVDFTNTRYQYNYRFSEYQTTLNGMELGGEHQINNKIKLDWAASEYLAKFIIETPNTTPANQRGLPIATFRQRINNGFNGLAADGRKYWYFDSPDGTGDDPMNVNINLKNSAEVMDATKLTLQQMVIFRLNNIEKDQTAQFNVKYTINPKINIKWGAKYRHKTRDGINQQALVWVPNAALGVPGAPPLVALSSLERASFPMRGHYFEKYNGDRTNLIVDPISKQQLFNLFDTSFIRINGMRNVSAASNPTLLYDGFEDVYAGYIMTELDLSNKIKIVAGFRNEYTNLELRSTKMTTLTENGATVNKFEPTKATSSYNSFLPMFNIRYKVQDNANIRMAFTRTFVRPDFPNLIPNETTNLTTNPASITRGNPNLQATYSNNFDVMGEYYFKNIGLISGGVFYKQIDNVIFTDRYLTTINGTNFLIAEPKNLKKSSLAGFEAGINKRLDFLKGFWSGFGVEFNYTYIHSEVDVPRLVGTTTVIDKTSLPNQSKNLFNAILFYERNGFMVRLAGNHRGASVETINQQLGPDYYTWTDKNFTVDASSTITLNKRIKLFVELNNLTNEPLRTYMGDVRRPQMVEWYSQRGQAGIRWDIIK